MKPPHTHYYSRSQIEGLEFAECADCSETIIWTRVKSTQKSVPLDPKPVGGSEIDPAYAVHKHSTGE